MLEVGDLIGGTYRILYEIGRGGMSVVYLALNERANKTWAVKEVRRDSGSDPGDSCLRLTSETEMMKKLKHPNLPSIVDIIERDDSFLIVMDYIEGRTFQEILETEGPPAPDEVLEYARQLCDVLRYLHSRNPPIIYRDMKPSNIILQPNGLVSLVDFGTAREYKAVNATDTAYLGTRGYAAPEQFGGKGQTDRRTDIYNLGATLFHLLTGKSPAETQFVISAPGLIRPELSGTGIEKIVLRCCEPDPDRRFRDCEELMYALLHAHDWDEKARRSRVRRCAAFFGAVFLMVSGLAVMAGSRRISSEAEGRSYESLLRRAGSFSNDVEQMAELFGQAMDLQPYKAEAYVQFLDLIICNNVRGEEEEFTRRERELFMQCAHNCGRGNGGEMNLEILKRKRPDDYARLMYTLGLDLYFYASGAQLETYGVMLELDGSRGLGEHEQAVRNTVMILSEYYVRMNQVFVAEEETPVNRASLWEKYYETAADPDAVTWNAGGDAYALALYRMIMLGISSDIAGFLEEGVPAEEMKEVLDAGRLYAGRMQKDQNMRIRELAEQVLLGTECAQEVITAVSGGGV